MELSLLPTTSRFVKLSVNEFFVIVLLFEPESRRIPSPQLLSTRFPSSVLSLQPDKTMPGPTFPWKLLLRTPLWLPPFNAMPVRNAATRTFWIVTPVRWFTTMPVPM